MHRGLFFYLIPLAFLVLQCRPKPDDSQVSAPVEITSFTKEVWVVNEGLFHSNNSTVTLHFPDSGKTFQNVFESVNSRELGDTGNDIAKYGSKIYIVVNVSGTLEVLDSRTFKSVKQISFTNNGKSREPRKIVFHGGNAFVSSFDGTVAVVDTLSLTITQFIKAGRNPESLVVYGNKLYVTNSGALDFPDYDHTVSVIDLITLKEVNKIEVGINPGGIAVDSQGDLYVISRGNYDDIPARMKLVSTKSEEVVKEFDFNASGIEMIGDSALITQASTTGGKTRLILFNPLTEQILSSDFINSEEFETLYAIAQDKQNGNIYISDAKGYVNQGKVKVFDRSGKKKYEFDAGLNPGDIEIVNTKQ